MDHLPGDPRGLFAAQPGHEERHILWRSPSTQIIEGNAPDQSTDPGCGVTAIPVPGHTKGSVVYRVGEAYLSTGDSLSWEHEQDRMHAFQEACWFSWPVQKAFLAGLANFSFNRLFAGHGSRSPWRLMIPHISA